MDTTTQHPNFCRGRPNLAKINWSKAMWANFEVEEWQRYLPIKNHFYLPQKELFRVFTMKRWNYNWKSDDIMYTTYTLTTKLIQSCLFFPSLGWQICVCVFVRIWIVYVCVCVRWCVWVCVSWCVRVCVCVCIMCIIMCLCICECVNVCLCVCACECEHVCV